MDRSHRTTVYRFGAAARECALSLEQAVAAMAAGEVDAILTDVVPPGEVEAWWDDRGFVISPFTRNAHHAGIVATAITVGQMQREEGAALVSKVAEYFALACRLNASLRETKFVRLFADELGAAPLTLGSEYPAEFLLATRREYRPYDAPFNFAPHCDDISYARDVRNWPATKSYARQLGAFLTIQGSANDAGMVLWQMAPPSRASLDQIHGEYRRDGRISAVDGVAELRIKPQPGQLTIFHSKNLHAIERCSSLRRTIGLFLIEEGGWRAFD